MQISLKTLATLIGAASLICTSASAYDFSQNYVRVGAALFAPVEDDIFDPAVGALLAAGHSWESSNMEGWHSVELETGYVKFSESIPGASADLEIVPLTIGYRYDHELTEKLTLGAGINVGVAFTEGSVGVSGLGSASDTDSTFIWSPGLRAKYAFTENVALNAGYRYMVVGDLEYGGVITLDDNDTHVIELGLEFTW